MLKQESFVNRLIIRLLSLLGKRIFFFEYILHEFKSKKFRELSYANEFDALDALTARLGMDVGDAVDIASSDGLSQSCTYGFYKKGWGGLCVEMDSSKFALLSHLYREFNRVGLVRARVTPHNVVAILKSNEILDDFDLLNFDIDSYDLRVIEEILVNGYKPKIVTMEINEKIPPNIFFTVEYSEEHYWQGDHFYGCSIGAAYEVMRRNGYILHSLEWNNAVFILESIGERVGMTSLSPDIAFSEGYKNRPGRKELFPWNHNVDFWLDINSEDALIEIKKHFSKYSGKYTCYLV